MLSENWRAGYAETCTSGSEGRVAKPRVAIDVRRVALTLHIALAIRVLPKATDRGKDLGLVSTAIFLPLIVSPILGASILNTVHSFAVLFLLAALASLLAAVCILPIRSVR